MTNYETMEKKSIREKYNLLQTTMPVDEKMKILTQNKDQVDTFLYDIEMKKSPRKRNDVIKPLRTTEESFIDRQAKRHEVLARKK